MRFLVVGAGSWGTAFTRILLDRGHDVVLACRSREHAEAIAQTGRNPHYLQGVDLSSVEPVARADAPGDARSEEHTSELQSPCNLVCRLLLEKKKKTSTRALIL